MSKKKFYAVARGYTSGIYDNWPEAQSQVKGFPGALYKGFPTRIEAENWLKKPSYNQSKRPKKPAKQQPPTHTHIHQGDQVTIYTDGGSINNPGPGGFGVVQVYGEHQKEISGGFRLTTNNRMELMGCIVALRELEHKDKPINLFSDSSYVVNGIQKGWALGWRKRGWIKADKKPAINADLWAELLNLVEHLEITFNWVKGHAGNPLNERCDQLAVASAKQKNLPVDKGYKKNK